MLLVFFAAGTFAQSPDKILKQAAKALGGEKALKAVRSRSLKGTLNQLALNKTGTFHSQSVADNSYYYSYDIDGFETSAGYNGKTAWTRDSRNGAHTLTGNPARDLQTEAAYRFYGWLDYKTDKARLVYGGEKQISGKSCSLVTLTTVKGGKVNLYFDRQTGLPVREEYPLGDKLRTFDYTDFRKVDSVMEPFSIRMDIDDAPYRIDVEQVTHNENIARANFDFPVLSNAPLPKIPELLAEVSAHQDKLEEMLEEYTYTESSVGRAMDKDGTAKDVWAATSQITFYKGNRINRQTGQNGKPLTDKQQEKEDKKVAGQIADIDKKIAKQEKNGEDDESERISIAEILRASNLINPRRETFRGREVIVFDFEPNPSFDLKNAKSILKLFGHAAGVIWIDEKDKQVARMEAYLADSVNFAAGMVKLRKGASFSMEQDRINDEIWLPSASEVNLSARVLLLKGVTVNQSTRYADYKKFKTEVKDAKVDPVKEQ
jgi:hypothetical protein